MRSERQALADIAKLRQPGPDGVLRWRVGHVGRKLDAILADVEPTPAPAGGTIDRDALRALWGSAYPPFDEWADRILALVRPVEGGVVLTREEALLAADALRKVRVDETRVHYTKYLALAERLEAAK